MQLGLFKPAVHISASKQLPEQHTQKIKRQINMQFPLIDNAMQKIDRCSTSRKLKNKTEVARQKKIDRPGATRTQPVS